MHQNAEVYRIVFLFPVERVEREGERISEEEIESAIEQGSSSPFCQLSSEKTDIGQLCDMSSHQKTFHSHHLNRLLFKLLFLPIACSLL